MGSGDIKSFDDLQMVISDVWERHKNRKKPYTYAHFICAMPDGPKGQNPQLGLIKIVYREKHLKKYQDLFTKINPDIKFFHYDVVQLEHSKSLNK